MTGGHFDRHLLPLHDAGVEHLESVSRARPRFLTQREVNRHDLRQDDRPVGREREVLQLTASVDLQLEECVTAHDANENETTKGGFDVKTLTGVVATTVPTDWSGDCEFDCSEHCQDCDECYERCMEECMRDRRARALDNILVAPNPYRGSADWERSDFEGTIMFQNLPKRCSIFIYSLTGELIRTVYHNMPGDGTPDPEGSETGGERWDMLSYNRMSIASGIYIYRVVSDEYGEAIGKFAVIRGER